MIKENEKMVKINDDIKGNERGSLTGKYLTFALETVRYGLEILKVQEIIGAIHITQVPKSPAYLKGVINLRGKIIPVVDLRLRLGMPEKDYDERTCFIVVNAEIDNRQIPVGVVVDTVDEVIHFDSSNIEPTPSYGAHVDTSFILGMGKTAEHVIILIDIDKTLAGSAEALLMSSVTNPEENSQA